MMQPNATRHASEEPWFTQLQEAANQNDAGASRYSIEMRQAAQRLVLAAAQHAAEGRDDVAKILCRNAATLADLAEKLL